jgi:hypothetical protein
MQAAFVGFGTRIRLSGEIHVESVSFHTHRLSAGILAALLGVFAAGSAAVMFFADSTMVERTAGAACVALFGWGLAVSLGRVFDRRPALVIDGHGIRDRRMKIDAPWRVIRGARLWTQEADAARAVWIALDVDQVDAVRPLPPAWARLRRATLERWGRPPVALNVQGLSARPEDVLNVIAHYQRDLAASERAR